MRPRTINLILLASVVTCSFLEVYTFDFYPKDPYDQSLDSFRLFAPGVLFSFFIVFLQRANFATVKLILFFIILEGLYFASLVAGFLSWGIGVPFAGGLGALLIRKLFYKKAEFLDSIGRKYFLIGFNSSMTGLVLYYLFKDVWTNGVGFGFILVSWQLAFGLLWIRQVEKTHKKTEIIS